MPVMQIGTNEINLLKDIYYRPEYAELYLRDEESLFTFEYREGDAVLYNLSIKRPIEHISGTPCNDVWFDLETAYGYGGFYTNSHDQGFVEQALEAYREYCRQERVIAEFIRFHPFNSFPVDHSKGFDLLIPDREVVTVNLDQSPEERWKQYGATTRNVLRRCAKALKFEPSDDLETFEMLYAKTMEKNNADDFYYFDRRYYEGLLNLDAVQLFQVLYEGNVIAMAFFMVGDELAHYHLSANDTDFLRLNGNYYMLDQAFEFAANKGAKKFVLGGGRSPDPDDSLLRFKKKFSRETRMFHIAGLIHNREVYGEYIAQWENMNPGRSIRYFLKYRL